MGDTKATTFCGVCGKALVYQDDCEAAFHSPPWSDDDMRLMEDGTIDGSLNYDDDVEFHGHDPVESTLTVDEREHLARVLDRSTPAARQMIVAMGDSVRPLLKDDRFLNEEPEWSLPEVMDYTNPRSS